MDSGDAVVHPTCTVQNARYVSGVQRIADGMTAARSSVNVSCMSLTWVLSVPMDVKTSQAPDRLVTLDSR